MRLRRPQGTDQRARRGGPICCSVARGAVTGATRAVIVFERIMVICNRYRAGVTGFVQRRPPRVSLSKQALLNRGRHLATLSLLNAPATRKHVARVIHIVQPDQNLIDFLQA